MEVTGAPGRGGVEPQPRGADRGQGRPHVERRAGRSMHNRRFGSWSQPDSEEQYQELFRGESKGQNGCGGSGQGCEVEEEEPGW